MSRKLTDLEQHEYDELASRLSDVTAPAESAQSPIHGAEAASIGRAMLEQQFGGAEALESAMRPGRPKLDAGYARGQSPEIRGRITQAQRAGIAKIKARTGANDSEIVRAAIDALIAQELRAS